MGICALDGFVSVVKRFEILKALSKFPIIIIILMYGLKTVSPGKFSRKGSRKPKTVHMMLSYCSCYFP